MSSRDIRKLSDFEWEAHKWQYEKGIVGPAADLMQRYLLYQQLFAYSGKDGPKPAPLEKFGADTLSMIGKPDFEEVTDEELAKRPSGMDALRRMADADNN